MSLDCLEQGQQFNHVLVPLFTLFGELIQETLAVLAIVLTAQLLRQMGGVLQCLNLGQQQLQFEIATAGKEECFRRL